MDELLRLYTIETPAGTFVIYPGSEAADPDPHQPLYWYYAPKDGQGNRTVKPSTPLKRRRRPAGRARENDRGNLVLRFRNKSPNDVAYLH